MIDWKARFRNKIFLTSLISALLLLAQVLGLSTYLPKNINDIINSILTILTILGIVVDTSTPGFADKPKTAITNYNDIK